MLPEIVEYQDILVPIATFLLGFFASRFTLSKEARLSYERAQFALSKEMAGSQNKAYNELMRALTKYVSEKGRERTMDDFFALSGPAQDYLFQQKMVADAILANKIDRQSRDATFVPKLVETADKVIPKVIQP
jgi:G3E family GTPase